MKSNLQLQDTRSGSNRRSSNRTFFTRGIFLESFIMTDETTKRASARAQRSGSVNFPDVLATDFDFPHPISYLRSTSDHGRLDDADDTEDHESFEPKGVKEEPPARERPVDGQAWPYRETLSFSRSLIFYGAGFVTAEAQEACKKIEKARKLREKYCKGGHVVCRNKEALESSEIQFSMPDSGVGSLELGGDLLIAVPSIEDFNKDYQDLKESCASGAMRSFSFSRLQTLSTAFKMHITLNRGAEQHEQSTALLGTDFYRTLKVDNHIHAAAAPSAKHFVNFIKDKLETEPDTVVLRKGGEETTLRQVYEGAGLDMDHLTIDAIHVLADASIFQRFDNFNSKIAPFQLSDMRRIFLKTSNDIEGRFFAEILLRYLERFEDDPDHKTTVELRLSIYGMNRGEWSDLARWLLHKWDHKKHGETVKRSMVDSDRNRWHVQIPRLWRIYSKPAENDTEPRSFHDMLGHIFIPLFEATLHPDENRVLAEALTHIVGFDSVDDEGELEESCNAMTPKEWTSRKNPSYAWQLYHIWANLKVLNTLRAARGLNTFVFRPHAGETGDPMHLAASYMLCESINHGLLLHQQVSLQYLYYLDQVGLAMSPLSNNFLFRKISSNPFPKFFARGLNVTLSTDDPLLFHMSDDALLEEYAVARASYDLSMTDLMEIARNSVVQSGFELEFKKKWLGPDFEKGLTHFDESLCHVPLIRAKYRAEHLALEHMIVLLLSAGKGDQVLQELKVQFGLARDAHNNILLECADEMPSFPERGQL